MLFTMRMLLSVVNQLGIERTLAEMWGAGGWDSTVGDYKRIGDWALAHGINFFNPHLSLVTTRGARKRDHPQTFSDHSAWWSEIKGLNDRIARLSFILSQGRMENRVLVLQPTTSAFLSATLTAEAQAEFERMRKEHGGLVQTLCDNQVDFDLGDEYILEEHGRIEKARLAVGREKYDLVIIPKGMTNMRHQTLTLLGKYLQSGGRVLALSSPAHWVDGRESGSVSRLKRQYPSRWREVRDVKNIGSGDKEATRTCCVVLLSHTKEFLAPPPLPRRRLVDSFLLQWESEIRSYEGNAPWQGAGKMGSGFGRNQAWRLHASWERTRHRTSPPQSN